jgi:hypothetical protein
VRALPKWHVSPQGENMGLVKRQPQDRRVGMGGELPLADQQDNHIYHDRRSGGQRRHSFATTEDLAVLFSEMPSFDSSQN